MTEADAPHLPRADALPIAPSMAPALEAAHAPRQTSDVSTRVLYVSGLSVLVALAASLVALVLTKLIGLITNLAFYGRFDSSFASPAENHLGLWVLVVPVLGGLVVGILARYGSKAIRGHGIPEAMEQILFNESRIPARLTFLKPLSAAIAIGTGGPFGAEGPIIATGGALGSVLGQVLRVTADERKTLLSAGAAAGMTATFGTPVSAVLLAIELLLFEYRARSIIPVAFACAVAAATRGALVGTGPVFAMPNIAQPGASAIAAYVVLGALIGVLSVVVTKAVYRVEDVFEKVPVHWMWWPAIGAVVVGVVGYIAPRTLGVGYSNIEDILSGRIAGGALVGLFVLKFVSWSIALGSGTSGGTLAPLFTIGGGAGASLGALIVWTVPGLGVDVRIAALVGMAAMFAGASHATLASVVFAFETTRQPMGLLPLLAGCTAAYLVSCLLMKTSIMTEKIARRGTRVRTEYTVDVFDQLLVGDFATRAVVSLLATDRVTETRAWVLSHVDGSRHTGFPVLEDGGELIGVLTRRDLLEPQAKDDGTLRDLVRHPAAVIEEGRSLREAADRMVDLAIGRLIVVGKDAPSKVVGILTRSDLLAAHKRRIAGTRLAAPSIALKRFFRGKPAASAAT
jgi:chloride channel protein, CIC family